MSLPILYQDQNFVAVNKPPGLLVHRSWMDPRATQFGLQMVRDQVGGFVYPLHRLDRPTAGVLLFARSKEVARALSEAFANRRVEKEYLAVVRGVPKLKLQQVDYPLKEELDPLGDAHSQGAKPAQEAITDIEVLAEVEFAVQVDRYPTARYALVKAKPRTGRKHQIRRHLRHIGHPIIGDVNHGVGKHNRYFSEQRQIKGLLLACTKIAFSNPVGGEDITIRAPLQGDFAKLSTDLGWDLLLEQ